MSNSERNWPHRAKTPAGESCKKPVLCSFDPLAQKNIFRFFGNRHIFGRGFAIVMTRTYRKRGKTLEGDQNYRAIRMACAMGRIMLQSGAEVYRVERTILLVCQSYGLSAAQCTVTPTVITACYSEKGKPITNMLRVGEQRLDLRKVELINQVSRKIEEAPMPLDELQKELSQIQQAKHYHFCVKALATGLGTGAFAILFGGTINDFFAGFIVGALLQLANLLLSHYKFQVIFARFIGGAVASALGGLVVYIGLGSRWDLITVSALTLLFPGLLFTNSLRDIATGDFVSAITHAVESFSIAAALAGGAALTHGIAAQIWGLAP